MSQDSRSEKVNVKCTHCGEQLKIPKKYFGKKVHCPTCKNRFRADQIVEDRPRRSERPSRPRGPQVLSYDEYMSAMFQRPSAVGWTGPAYMGATAIGSVAAIFALQPMLRRMGPKNYRPRRKPGIIAMLPFLIIGGLVFLVMSPIFYFLYRRGALKQQSQDQG